jgi:hypothetical protein
MCTARSVIFPLLALSVLCWNPSARAQGAYTLSTVLLNGTPVPGTTDNFSFNVEAGFSIDENFISFAQRSLTCDSNDGIWLINLGNGSIRQLVKEGSTAPGTGGETFSGCNSANDSNFGDYNVVKGLRVAFAGCSGSTVPCWGLYSASVFGAATTVAANQFSGIGTLSYTYAPDDVLHADDQHAVFPANGHSASYVANIDGSNLVELAGPDTPVAVPGTDCTQAFVDFYEPRVTGKKVIFIGNSVLANAGLFLTSLNGIPRTSTCGTNGYIDYAPVVFSGTALPVPGVVFQNQAVIAINQKELYFTAEPPNAIAPFPTAIFAENLDGTGGIRTVLNLTDQLPGFPPPPYYVFAMSAQFDTLVFEATPVAGGGSGIFVYQNGNVTRVVGSGDNLAGGPIAGLFLGSNALSNGRIVFGFSNDAAAGIGLAK